MTKYEELYNRIQNNKSNDVYTEAPIDKWMDTIKDIKDSKPDEYSDEKEIKDFIDDNYSDISKIAKLLEEEPEKIKKAEIGVMIGYISTFIAAMIAFDIAFVGVGLMIISFGLYIIGFVIIAVRSNHDMKAYKELCKIRESLKKIKDKKIPESYKRKISKLINDIDDMQTEFTNGPIKVTESTSDEEIEIVEAYTEGLITYDEMDYLLSSL